MVLFIKSVSFCPDYPFYIKKNLCGFILRIHCVRIPPFSEFLFVFILNHTDRISFRIPSTRTFYHQHPLVLPPPFCSGSSPLAGKSSLLGRASHASLVSFRSLNMNYFEYFHFFGFAWIHFSLALLDPDPTAVKFKKMMKIKF
jgi:hypothetical protein